ncbi:MAG: aminopeptidase N [Thermodesulfobacteriota bacterium]
MTEAEHQTIYLADYRMPDYLVSRTELTIELNDATTLVKSRLTISANYDREQGGRPLILDGQELTLKSIRLNGEPLAADLYQVDEKHLTITAPPPEMILEIENIIHPDQNTALEGLYKSGDKLCTQCEAEGFRRITWFADRPDVLSRFEVTLVGDPEKYPVMLANGNRIDSGHLDDGHHWVKWQDPFPKPGYLFAMVAGRLSLVEDFYTTGSGRRIALQFFVEPHNLDRCGHALESLKKAMAWDEETYGLEYDLDQYMVVAVDDFNMGAMENKGLNVFNSKYVLATPATATDTDYENIEAVIGHEYFHNWTGNRVTCRDWFQLSLKEGLTVFRDQEFSADMTSRPVKRISDVTVLRSHQFPEDKGPMAHPVRTDSYIEINNFYTITVYEKGAELVRMIHTLLGQDGFRRGLQLYLEKHDGEAATVEDFVGAMAEAGGRELTQFMNWYRQAGTPVVKVSGEYDRANQTFTLTFRQSCPATPGQTDKEPFLIPVSIGLLGSDGRQLPLNMVGGHGDDGEFSKLLELRAEEESFTFTDITGPPTPSLLRGFSAPVKLEYDYSDAELGLLVGHDSDSFCRWEAAQILAVRKIGLLIDDYLSGLEMIADQEFIEIYRAVLADRASLDPAYLAQLLTLPSEGYLAEFCEVIEAEAIHGVREFVRRNLAAALRDDLKACFTENRQSEPYRYDPALAGRRALKNICLSYLVVTGDREAEELCLEQYHQADNMTDEFSSLRNLVHGGSAESAAVLSSFEKKWQKDPLVMDKWLAVQATVPKPETLAMVKELMNHPAFVFKNPNRVRALLGSFAMGNPVAFNQSDGSGYEFMAGQIIALDRLNPQTAARIAGCFGRWRRFNEARQDLAKAQLQRIIQTEKISSDLYEVVSRTLGKQS